MALDTAFANFREQLVLKLTEFSTLIKRSTVIKVQTTVPAEGEITWDLEDALGDEAERFDLHHPVMNVLIEDIDENSATYQSWVNGGSVITYGVKVDNQTAFVRNHFDAPLNVRVRIEVPVA